MKLLKWFLIIIGALLILAFAAFQLMKYQTKQASPESEVAYANGDLKINIDYSRPSKKDRTIFGGLVPYDTTWRTGANEATTFTTNKDLTIGGKVLPAGKYTLWTIPGPEQWTVIFNKKMYPWGVDWNTNASREAAEDAVRVEVPVEHVNNVTELFTIAFQPEPLALTMNWDQVRVSVPLAQ